MNALRPRMALDEFILMLEPLSVFNGAGKPVFYHLAMQQLQSQFNTFLDIIESGQPIPPDFKIFIPDLWHIAKGRAKSFPSGDGDRLWNEGCEARELIAKYLNPIDNPDIYQTDDGFNTGVPGRWFALTK